MAADDLSRQLWTESDEWVNCFATELNDHNFAPKTIRGFTNWSIYGDSVATPPKMYLSPVKSALEYKDFMGIENPVIQKDLSDLNPALRKRNRSFVLEEKLYFACNQNVLRMGKKKPTTVIEGTEGSIEFIDTNGGFILVGWSYEDTPGCFICAFDKELQRVGGLKTEPDLVSFVALEERALFLNSEGEVRCWNYDDTQILKDLKPIHIFCADESCDDEAATFLGIESLGELAFYVVEATRIIVFSAITRDEDEWFVDDSTGENAYQGIIAYVKDEDNCIVFTGCGILQSVSMTKRNKINWRIGIPTKLKFTKFPAEIDVHEINEKKIVTIVWTQNEKLVMKSTFKAGGKTKIGANVIEMVPDEQEEIFAICIEHNSTSLPVLLPAPLDYIKKVVELRSDDKVLDYRKAKPHLVAYRDSLYVFCGMYLLKYEEQETDSQTLMTYFTQMFYKPDEKRDTVELHLDDISQEPIEPWSFSFPETIIRTDYELGAKGTRNNIARMMDLTWPVELERHEIDGSLNERECANIVYNTMREEELSVKKISEVRMKRMSYLQNMTAMEQSLAEMNTLALADVTNKDAAESKHHKHEKGADEAMEVDTDKDVEDAEDDMDFCADVKGEVLSSDAESLAPIDFRDVVNMDESVLAGFQPQSQIALPEPESQNDEIIASKGEIYSLGAPAESSTQKTAVQSSQPTVTRTPSLKRTRTRKPVAETIFEETEDNEESTSQDLFAKATQPDSLTQEPSQTETPSSQANTTVLSLRSSQNTTLKNSQDSPKTPKSSKKATKEDRMKKKKMKARKSIGF